MPSASEVRPKAWSEIMVLYDDGYYSVIWGCFRQRPFKNLGVRYNEGDNPGGVGYPNLGGNPLWHVEPPLLVESILLCIQKKLQEQSEAGATSNSPHAEYLRNIEIALHQSQQQAPTIPKELGGQMSA